MRRALAFLFVALLVPCVQAASAPSVPTTAWVWSDPGGDGDLPRLHAALDRLGLAWHDYPHLGMASFVADATTARALQRLSGGRVDADLWVPTHLDKSVPYIGADRVKQALGSQRNGPTVLVVDTGVDSTHPDFQAGNLAVNAQAVRQGGLVVTTQEQGPVVDLSGHGTHVAGIVAGSGASLGNNDPLHGKYTGVYSIGRVASYQASAQSNGEEDAEVEILAALEAFDWAIANQARFDLRVVSDSWGEQGSFDPNGPVEQATLRLYLAGFTVVFSAGNNGEGGPGLNKYCEAPWVLCVAAGDLDDSRLDFSSYGVNDAQTPWAHPDLTAPGLFITAPKPINGLTVSQLNGLLGGGDLAATLYVDRSGTSMAAPHVAGVAGLLQAANPTLSPDQVMDILTATASPMADGPERVGAGYVDARRAYNLALGTTGNRDQFLSGAQVKYAGKLSHDPTYANDALSVGYDGSAGSPVLALERPADPFWLFTPVPLVLVGLALVCALAGTRWRRSS